MLISGVNMKGVMLSAVFFGALVSSSAAWAEVMPRNKAERTVVALVETAFNQKKPQEAWDLYGGPYYTQHNPTAADGKEAVIALLNAWLPTVPDLHYDIKRIISHDDLVMIHSHVTTGPDDLGNAVVDIFRLENGKVVEHWDVGQPVPETSMNNNGMF